MDKTGEKVTLYNMAEIEGWETALIVYDQSSFVRDFSREERTYRVRRSNRFFQEGKISNSLFGDCLDGTDLGVRLDLYNWKIEEIILEEEK